MEIYLPKEIEHYEPEIKFFMDLMIRKLHINRHKGYGTNVTISELCSMLDDEIVELRDALCNESQFNVALEAVDVANFGFLIALVAMRQTREEFNRGRAK